AGAFSFILQIGTTQETYWPTVDTVPALLDKHLFSTLELLQVAGQLPPKATVKGPASAIARGVQTAPLVLGLILLLLLCIGYVAARFLGYDDIFGRFKTNVARLQRRLAAAFSDSGYIGVPGGGGSRGNGRAHDASGEPGRTKTWWQRLTGAAPSRSSTVAGSGAAAAGGAWWTPAPPAVLGSGGTAASFDDEEIGFEDLLELDGDTAAGAEDDGVGYSYRH
ncbi:hypothetical protein HK405_001401, partial [Cladochytrium tenue]